MPCKVQQSVRSGCVTYEKSRIVFNQFNTFNNVIELKVTFGKGHTIEDFLYLLEECEYNPIWNRRYVCAYSKSECELRVLKAFC